ncbi:MAG: SLBB domain-containing protein [Desulfuromonadales bacterium]
MKGIWIAVLLLGALLSAGPGHAVDNNYRIGEGDIIRITVYDNPDLTTQTRVTSNGTINFPLIGTVQIGALSVGQVAEAIAGRLSGGYLVDPQVAVFVEEFRSQKAVIMGEVATPGLYELSGHTTLLQLISKAGGVTPDADDTVSIRRTAEGRAGEQVVTVDLQKILETGDPSLDVAILDGDSIFVNKAGVFYVTGEVRKPDSYRLEKGISVITAITKAGGFTELASKGKVRIIRKIDGREKTITNVSLHEPVQVNDVIVVPESFF